MPRLPVDMLEGNNHHRSYGQETTSSQGQNVVMRSDVVMRRDSTGHRWCEGCPDPMHAIIILGIAKAAYGPGACMCSRRHADGPRQSCWACTVRGHRHTKRSLTALADSGADLWSSPARTVAGMVPQVKREPSNNGNCRSCLCLCFSASASPSCPPSPFAHFGACYILSGAP